MTLYDYLQGRRIAATEPSFYALIHAAFRKADAANYERLRLVFPDVARELQERYELPGGRLANELGVE